MFAFGIKAILNFYFIYILLLFFQFVFIYFYFKTNNSFLKVYTINHDL